MPTAVKVGQQGLPFALGKIIPGATFATVSVPLTQNYQPVMNDGTTHDNLFNSISIQAHPDNLKPLYVCNSAAAPDTTNYTNVIWILLAGASFPRAKEWANNRDISKIYIGSADNATDFAIASIDAV